MDLKDVMAISGRPGLYKFVAQGRNAVIVENIQTGKRTSAFASERINSLEEITVFTEEKDRPLKEVFRAMYEKEAEGTEAVPPKSDNNTLKEYFGEVMPDYDRERVYVSDIKKILTWYHILKEAGMLSFEEEEEEKENKEEEEKKAGSGKEETEKEDKKEE